MSWANGTLLAERYVISACLQQRPGCATYRAQRLPDGASVILKSLELQGLPNWDPHTQFEREISILGQLKHPRIPQVLDHFQADTHNVLVLECLPGETLRQRLDAGVKFSESQARQFAREVLEILVYLHRQTPPIVHRDIKPANLMIDAAGHVSLIDFGAVKALTLTPGQTVAGTFGYMAPEQALSQQPHPASDLYALGVTLVEMLSRQSPLELPRRDLHLDFHGAVQVSPDLLYWLDQLVEPNLSQRLPSAQAALAALDREAPAHKRQGRKLGETRLTQHSNARGQLALDIQPQPAWPPLLRLCGMALIRAHLWWFVGSTLVWAIVVPLAILSLPPAVELTKVFMAINPFAYLAFIGWQVLREGESLFRPHHLRLQAGELRHHIGGWVSRRQEIIPLAQIKRFYFTADHLVFHLHQRGWRKWLHPFLTQRRLPMTLSDTEKSVVQQNLRRAIQQQLPPEQAQELLRQNF
ncbi:MAG: serine/threonine protein kinase [Candidatus Sericytochromatia bacterium]